MDKYLTIEIAYGNCEQQWILSVTCLAGTTVATVLDQANLKLIWRDYRIGSFSHFLESDMPLSKNCRLELYRPLLLDPKQARLLRAKKNPLIRIKHRNIRGFDSRLTLIEKD